MTSSYGYPPDWSETTEAPVPETLKTVTVTGDFPPGAGPMIDWLKKPYSDVAIARQLNIAYDFGRDKPVRVNVPGRGWFLLGPEGWVVQKH